MIRAVLRLAPLLALAVAAPAGISTPASERTLVSAVGIIVDDSNSAGLITRIEVSETAGIARQNETVVTGAPLARSAAVERESELGLRGPDGRPVPVQVTAVARWDAPLSNRSAPLKWVRLTFPVNLVAGGRETFSLYRGGLAQGRATLTLREDPSGYRVDTGSVSFLVPKTGAGPVSQVRLAGSGETLGDVAPGLEITRPDTGETFGSAVAPRQVSVLESGPQRVLLQASGTFTSARGAQAADGLLRYTFWVAATAGSPAIRVWARLENHGAYGYGPETKKGGSRNNLQVGNVELSLALPGGTRQVRTDLHAVTLGPGESTALLQTHQATAQQESRNFAAVARHQGRQVATGGRAEGWIAVTGESAGLLVAVQDFWQNAPKGLRVESDRLVLELLPSSEGPYVVEGGLFKTHEMVLVPFHPGASPDFATTARAATHPPVSRPDAEQIVDSGVLGMFAPLGAVQFTGPQQEALDRYERLQRSKLRADAADTQGGWGKATIPVLREGESDYGLAGNGYWYGWRRFGGLPWARGSSMLHYDHTWSMLLQFLRSGDPAFFEMADEMARYRYDLGQYHADERLGREPEWTQGLARHEGGFDRIPQMSHTWSGGLVLHHLLTGDPRSWEAALENRQAVRNLLGALENGPTNDWFFPGTYEIRQQGWSLLNLLHVGAVSGDRADADLARAIGLNSLLYLEQQTGGTGYWGGDQKYGEADPGAQNMLLICYVVEPLIRLHVETQDAEIAALIRRVAAWVRDNALLGGVEGTDGYVPTYLPWTWRADGNHQGDDIPLTWFLADLFAYDHWLSGDVRSLEIARRIFRDSVFYLQAEAGAVVNGDFRSALAYGLRKFPNTESKIQGWTGRTHHIYQWVEWQLQRRAAERRGAE